MVYNIWYTQQVTKQLEKGKDPADVEVSSNFDRSNHYMLSGFLRCTNTCKDTMTWLSMVSKEQKLVKQYKKLTKFSTESKARLSFTEKNRINYQEIVWHELLGI